MASDTHLLLATPVFIDTELKNTPFLNVLCVAETQRGRLWNYTKVTKTKEVYKTERTTICVYPAHLNSKHQNGSINNITLLFKRVNKDPHY
jgi:hypothetical protein